MLRSDVLALREAVDVVVVAFHKGIGHVPVAVPAYERELARTAIDCGADIVVGHHAHILRGIELYRGKPVFHGLGNFVAVTHALTPSGADADELAAWSQRRRELFGFAPDPEMPFYPFHPESRNTMVADCRVGADGSDRSGLRAVLDRRPRPPGSGRTGVGRRSGRCLRRADQRRRRILDELHLGRRARARQLASRPEICVPPRGARGGVRYRLKRPAETAPDSDVQQAKS